MVRSGCLVLLLAVACRSSGSGSATPPDAAPADAAGFEEPDTAAPVAPPDAGPNEPLPPARTACRWTVAEGLCAAGTLCPSVTAGFFDCAQSGPVPKPGIDGQGRPRVLLAGHLYHGADLGQLVRFAGKVA